MFSHSEAKVDLKEVENRPVVARTWEGYWEGVERGSLTGIGM